MSDKLQIIDNSEKYFLEKKQEIQSVLILSNKTFLEKSYDFKKFKLIKSEPSFVFLITGWIAQTSLLMQIKSPVDAFIKQDIINMLTTIWSNLSLEELIKAFELERFGVFEEKTEHYQLFDCNYISQVLKKYNKWKTQTKMDLNIENKKEENILSEEEIETKTIQGVNNKYIEFKKTNEIIEPYGWIFKELVERGIIKIATAQTPKLSLYYENKLKDAKILVLNDLKDDSNNKSNKEIIKSIVSESYNLDAKNKIELKAKKLVLIDFFKNQISLNKEQIL